MHLAHQCIDIRKSNLISQPLMKVQTDRPPRIEITEAGEDLSVELRPRIELPGLLGGVRSLSFSSTSGVLAAACFDGLVRTWDVQTWQPRHVLGRQHGGAWDLAFSSTEPHILVTVGGDLDAPAHSGRLVLWDVLRGQRVSESFSPMSRCVAFSPDGKSIAAGSYDGTIQLWNVASHRMVRTFRAHSAAIDDVCFRPDSSTLASASVERSVRFWSLESNLEPGELRGGQKSIRNLAVSDDSRLLASPSIDGTVCLWDVQTGKLRDTFSRVTRA